MNYGTVTNNILTPAPRAIIVNGAMVTNPKAEHFAALNAERAKLGKPPYLEVVDTPPQTDAAHYAVATGWKMVSDLDDEAPLSYQGNVTSAPYYRRQYEVRETPPPPPRTFDKYMLVDALMNAGVWDRVEAWLKETPNAWTRALMAPDISEDEPLLAQGIAAVKELLGWTDAQVEAVLAASVKEGY
jgi:hypothetical protein